MRVNEGTHAPRVPRHFLLHGRHEGQYIISDTQSYRDYDHNQVTVNSCLGMFTARRNGFVFTTDQRDPDYDRWAAPLFQADTRCGICELQVWAGEQLS